MNSITTSEVTNFGISAVSGLPAGMKKLEQQFIEGEKGRIETLTVKPATPNPAHPTLYFLVGWWGAASDYVPVMAYYAGLGFLCRSFSWRGTGESGGNSFWGLGYENDLLRVVRHFGDERISLIAHSGAVDYVRNALPQLQRESEGSIETAIFVAPLSREGAMRALLTWLKPDRSGTNILRWMRFLGSNVFGLAWFMRHEIALRRVLLSEGVSIEVVKRVGEQIDRCPYGRYFLSLWRFPKFLQPRRLITSEYGVRSMVLHCELDQNFSTSQQRATAEAFGADFVILPNACHQWFADAYTFSLASEHILDWLKAGASKKGAEATALAA